MVLSYTINKWSYDYHIVAKTKMQKSFHVSTVVWVGFEKNQGVELEELEA